MPAGVGPILVTGAGGFIGRRIVRQLGERGYRVRALVRRPPAPTLGASVDVVAGDLLQADTYAAALRGASAVVHAALTHDHIEDVRVTSALQGLSAQAGVQKFIHLSSIAVYGTPADGIVTEQTTPLATNDRYASTKLAVEEALAADSRIPETVILRLGCVYGPGGGWWTEGLMNLMQRGRVILVNEGTGLANLIHVDDVCALLLLFLMRGNPQFDIFNVTDGQPVTWRRYFSALEDILGRTATVSMSVAEAQRYGRKSLHPSFGRRLVRKLLGTGYIHPLSDRDIANYASRAAFSNEKAVVAVGFKPRYDLEHGMQTVGLPASPVPASD